MRYAIATTLFASALALAAPAPAQLIFSKKAKINPTQRVPELILIVKTDPDERKRAIAAEELRDYDTTTFTEIVPVLADVLLNDKKPSVRAEALLSLSRIRPVSAIAGQAIEKAAADDETLRLRWQARAALPKYHLAGYTSRKTESAPAANKAQSNEPPLASPAPTKATGALPKLQPPPAGSSFPRPLPPGVAREPARTKSPATTPPPPVVDGPSLFPK